MLLHLAEVASIYIGEVLAQTDALALNTREVLSYVKNLCAVCFGLNNVVHLDKHNFALFCQFNEQFFAIGFQSSLNSGLVNIYKQSAETLDEELISRADTVLGFGVSWFKGLLDNPSIWISDLVFSDRDAESTGQAE